MSTFYTMSGNSPPKPTAEHQWVELAWPADMVDLEDLRQQRCGRESKS